MSLCLIRWSRFIILFLLLHNFAQYFCSWDYFVFHFETSLICMHIRKWSHESLIILHSFSVRKCYFHLILRPFESGSKYFVTFYFLNVVFHQFCVLNPLSRTKTLLKSTFDFSHVSKHWEMCLLIISERYDPPIKYCHTVSITYINTERQTDDAQVFTKIVKYEAMDFCEKDNSKLIYKYISW